MIPGDIDLTENLDFRNVKKRETPQLPASWKSKDKLNISSGDLSTYISSNSTYNIITPNTFSWTYYTESDSNITTIRADYQLSWTTTSYDNYLLNTWNDYNEYEINSLSYYNYDDKISLEFEDNKSEYDVFGNKIIQPKPIHKIPWNTKVFTPSISQIAWKKRKWIIYNKDYIPDIQWETEEEQNWNWYHNNIDLSTPIKRAKNLISWLSKRSTSFIERYFDKDDEKVDMSYLTNMSWIRVHDAVIDSI